MKNLNFYIGITIVGGFIFVYSWNLCNGKKKSVFKVYKWGLYTAEEFKKVRKLDFTDDFSNYFHLQILYTQCVVNF